ncbi:hypothetical protein AVEN_87539-1 [Araneus ventricosus]|uniref:Uncharacterized protein n=1 Tax=Araneus ventricosus TaxID=182803 RepID=A0A4Y2TCR6_ARAVE|nr:hypothetical protein AVEN_87539-1 [Araneus ventricosus]
MSSSDSIPELPVALNCRYEMSGEQLKCLWKQKRILFLIAIPELPLALNLQLLGEWVYSSSGMMLTADREVPVQTREPNFFIFTAIIDETLRASIPEFPVL